MSIKFQKEIFSDGRIKVFINFSGIASDNSTNKSDLALTIFAIDQSTYKHVFSVTLNCEQTKSLYNHLNGVPLIKDDNENNECQFIEMTNELSELLPILNKVDSKLLKSLLSKVNENEKLKLVLEALSESEIQNLHAAIRQTTHQKALHNLLLLLKLESESNIIETIQEHSQLQNYFAKQPEKIFQNLIEQNIWTLGIDYIKKHSARQIGINSESDLIMETTDGFIDLIELKRPKFDLFSFDDSHKGYYPSKELSKVIGQCMQYLKVLEEYKLILEKQYKFKILKPRIKIIVGRSNRFTEEQQEALRMLNGTLNQMQIITFDYLFACGENIISYYNRQLEHTFNEESEEILASMS
jgi:hypothetical protein